MEIVKVKSHSEDFYNGYANNLAKCACLSDYEIHFNDHISGWKYKIYWKKHYVSLPERSFIKLLKNYFKHKAEWLVLEINRKICSHIAESNID